MTLYQPEPVEISTRMRPDEWTEASLSELVTTYQNQLREMGAPESEIVTEVDRDDEGGVSVTVTWAKGDIADAPGMEQTL
jgi:hypothetical protein